jgi:hypothetical protein
MLIDPETFERFQILDGFDELLERAGGPVELPYRARGLFSPVPPPGRAA